MGNLSRQQTARFGLQEPSAVNIHNMKLIYTQVQSADTGTPGGRRAETHA